MSNANGTLQTQLLEKLKPNAVKNEADRAAELKRAVMRTLIALQVGSQGDKHWGHSAQ